MAAGSDGGGGVQRGEGGGLLLVTITVGPLHVCMYVKALSTNVMHFMDSLKLHPSANCNYLVTEM